MTALARIFNLKLTQGTCEAPLSGATRSDPTHQLPVHTKSCLSSFPPFNPTPSSKALQAREHDVLHFAPLHSLVLTSQDGDHNYNNCTRHWSSNGHCTHIPNSLLGRLIDLVFLIARGISYLPFLTGRRIGTPVTSHDNLYRSTNPFDAPARSPDCSLSRIAHQGSSSSPWYLQDIRASRRSPPRSWLQRNARIHARGRLQCTLNCRKGWWSREWRARECRGRR